MGRPPSLAERERRNYRDATLLKPRRLREPPGLSSGSDLAEKRLEIIKSKPNAGFARSATMEVPRSAQVAWTVRPELTTPRPPFFGRIVFVFLG